MTKGKPKDTPERRAKLQAKRDKQQKAAAEVLDRDPRDHERTLTEQRIDRCVSIMAAGNWIPTVTEKLLRTEFGLSGSRIHELAGEANRVLRRSVGRDNEVRYRLLATIDALRMHASTKTRTVRLWNKARKQWDKFDDPDPDIGSALKAAELYGKYLGLLPNKIIIAKDDDDFDGWTDQELEAYATEGQVPLRLRETIADDIVDELEARQKDRASSGNGKANGSNGSGEAKH